MTLTPLYFGLIQAELEDTKAQEVAKLQEALHTMHKQVEEANAKVVQEREAARRAIEEAPPVIKETPVIVHDTEKINALSAEVDNLKVWFHCLKVYYL